jgi:precorrin-6A/cobalt-precorrin-6A reductase
VNWPVVEYLEQDVRLRPKAQILILGGTCDARKLAQVLVELGHDVETSLAGVTTRPVLPAGKIRFGGFGGAEGLKNHLASNRIDILIDATHPFAEVISRSAVIAAAGSDVVILRLERPAWTAGHKDNWFDVEDVGRAAAFLPSGARVFLAIGRKQIAPFMERGDIGGVLRMIEPPEAAVSAKWKLILDRPRQTAPEEIALMRQHEITHLVCKNSGGSGDQKLAAARELGLPVIMVMRPRTSNGVTYSSIADLVASVNELYP